MLINWPKAATERRHTAFVQIVEAAKEMGGAIIKRQRERERGIVQELTEEQQLDRTGNKQLRSVAPAIPAC